MNLSKLTLISLLFTGLLKPGASLLHPNLRGFSMEVGTTRKENYDAELNDKVRVIEMVLSRFFSVILELIMLLEEIEKIEHCS